MIPADQPEADGRTGPVLRRDVVPVDQSASRQMAAGLMIAGVGIVLILGRFGVLETKGVWPLLFPLFLIGLGVAKLLAVRPDGTRHGAGWVLVGVWLLLSTLHVWRVGESWPLLLVAWGIKIVWNAVNVPALRSE